MYINNLSNLNYLSTDYSPIGLWTLNNTLNDSSGNGYNLSVLGAVSGDPAAYANMGRGIIGWNTAIGASNYVDEQHEALIGINEPSLRLTSNMTLQCIMLVAGPPSEAQNSGYGDPADIISCDGYVTTGDNYNVLYSLGLIRAYTYESNLYSPCIYYEHESTGSVKEQLTFQNLTYPINKPFHIAMVRDGLTVTAYVNGASQTLPIVNLPYAGTVPAQRFLISGSNTSVFTTATSHGCFVSSVKLNDSALSKSQILNEYKKIFGG